MKLRFKETLVAGSLVSAACLSGVSGGLQAAEITWRLQTVAGAGTTEYTKLVESFARNVKEETGGRVEVKTYPAGMLMKSGEVVEAVSKGTLDMGHTYLVYYSGKEPALKAVNEWPAEVEPAQGYTWYYESGGAEMMRKITAKHNIYSLGVTELRGEQIWSRKELKGVDDLKGVKIRASGLAADSFARLGASVVSLPGEEVYQALQRGVIDATEFTTMAVNYGLGFHEVAKFVAMPSYSGGGTSDWIVNLAAWNKVPADLMPKIESALKRTSADFAKFAAVEEKEILEKLQKAGVKLVQWSDADMRKLERARIDVMREKYSNDSPLYAEKFDSQMKWLQRLGYKEK